MENLSVRSQEPSIVWNHFADINAVPRASKKEERIVAFMVQFGKNLGLETIANLLLKEWKIEKVWYYNRI